MTLGSNTSRTYLLLLKLHSFLQQNGSNETTPQTITPGVRSLCHSIMYSGRQRWQVQRLIQTWPSWFQKLKLASSKKTTWCQSIARICVHEPITSISDADVDGLSRGGSCIKAPLQAVHGAADIDELTKPTLVHLQQQTNVLPTAQRKLYDHSTPCGAGVNCRALTSPFVIYCQFFELFAVRWSIASRLASLWNSSAAHHLLLRNRKILLLEG